NRQRAHVLTLHQFRRLREWRVRGHAVWPGCHDFVDLGSTPGLLLRSLPDAYPPRSDLTPRAFSAAAAPPSRPPSLSRRRAYDLPREQSLIAHEGGFVVRPTPIILSVALGLALVATVGAAARPQATSIQIRTVMNATQEVPSPTGSVSNAAGTFSATVT